MPTLLRKIPYIRCPFSEGRFETPSPSGSPLSGRMRRFADIMRKVFVDIIVKFTKEGTTIPLSVIWEDGRMFDIDRVLDIRRAASLKAGGQGMRYKCRIRGRETFLWYEDGKWFVEAFH